MNLYEWITIKLLPIFGDITALEWAPNVFGYVFWAVLSLIVVHFVLVLPYRLVLKLMHYRGWRRK